MKKKQNVKAFKKPILYHLFGCYLFPGHNYSTDRVVSYEHLQISKTQSTLLLTHLMKPP